MSVTFLTPIIAIWERLRIHSLPIGQPLNADIIQVMQVPHKYLCRYLSINKISSFYPLRHSQEPLFHKNATQLGKMPKSNKIRKKAEK